MQTRRQTIIAAKVMSKEATHVVAVDVDIACYEFFELRSVAVVRGLCKVVLQQHSHVPQVAAV